MSKKRLLQCTVIAGGFLLNLPLGIPWYYGNLSTYTNSYFHFSIGPSAFNIRPHWMISAYILSSVLGFLTADVLLRKFGFHLLNLGSVLVFNLGCFLCFFTVKNSVGLLIVTLTLSGGYSTGIINILCLKCVAKVVPDRVGLASAVVCSALGFGAIVTNFAITRYLNPENLAPNIPLHDMVYFSQAAVLDRVPSVFIVIGLCTLAFHIPGYLMTHLPLLLFSEFRKIEIQTVSRNKEETTVLKENRFKSYEAHRNMYDSQTDNKNALSEIDSEREIIASPRDTDSKINSERTYSNEDVHSELNPGSEISKETAYLKIATESKSSRSKNKLDLESQPSTSSKINEERGSPKQNFSSKINADGSSTIDKEHVPSSNPWEVLRTRSFYQLVIAVSVLTYGNLLTQNYYKSFGQLCIKDDSFLTTVGSMAAVSTSVLRLAIGLTADVIGVKYSLALMLAMESVLLMFWFVAPRFDSWFYFLMNQLVFGVGGSIYILFPMAVLKLYGDQHYATNYGLVMVASVTASLISPPLFGFLLSHYGWFSLVLVGSSISVLAFISFILVMPR